jgi:hypothetical protein
MFSDEMLGMTLSHCFSSVAGPTAASWPQDTKEMAFLNCGSIIIWPNKLNQYHFFSADYSYYFLIFSSAFEFLINCQQLL